MSRLLYKDNEYTYSELFKLHKLSPRYKTGEVNDLENGHSWRIENIKDSDVKNVYFNEVISGVEKSKYLKKKDKINRRKELEDKYQNKNIKRQEIMELIKLSSISKGLGISYESFFIVNMQKPKPKGLTHSDYGKFMGMLNYLSYDNIVQYKSNGKRMTNTKIANYLDIGRSYFQKLKRKLIKYNMIGTLELGGIPYIAINPAYAQRNMELNHTIYMMFKKDLDPMLHEYQRAYLQMENDDVVISNLWRLED